MIKVLVVDDSVVVRRLIVDALSDDPGIEVVGTASNGRLALAKIEELKPDVMTLDIEMPVLDGIGTLKELRPKHKRLPVIMFSTLTANGASATLEALAAGATDYVTKPANVGSVRESIKSVREQLIPRIYALGPKQRPAPGRPGLPPGRPGTAPPGRPGAPLAGRPPLGAPAAPSGGIRAPMRPAKSKVPGQRIDVIAVGCSTGGPDALAKVVQGFPKDLPVPVVVVQHMPPIFTKMFADRLDRASAVKVVEATADIPLDAGTVYIAPGDKHLEVVRKGTSVLTKLHEGPPENSCRPAVDPLFRSVASVFGAHALTVVLTGMGQDGKKGCEVLARVGSEIVVQDEETSVVWGMPGAVAQAGLADVVLPLGSISDTLLARVGHGRANRLAVVR
ncbi:protein-glutamate methylesterase/protein-glutamine glutaminase [Cryptosporangium arvum]|uniref:Protein-glutamate methylesterase/protein-glutamine glutaminase n=1 Tax=Cryptosporangium arvum DSM 44712 TaxID=927661 RepID=A0A010ZUR2_9ACTN|nr:chemotaxis response regulator protein-glutamate methylesterase [Cryptosporangium arvum]EXG80947.1 chemotaxis response regulator containing a CheY-like receiver domain and a methylesterase domain [Cryptosporangium arvum DSM 44712]